MWLNPAKGDSKIMIGKRVVWLLLNMTKASIMVRVFQLKGVVRKQLHVFKCM